jgi:hypothetical protein
MTTRNYLSRAETQFIFQAVGDVLLEINNFISAQEYTADCPDFGCSRNCDSTPYISDAKVKFSSKNAINDEDLNLCDTDVSININNSMNIGAYDRTRCNTKSLSETSDTDFVKTELKSQNSYVKTNKSFKVESFFSLGKFSRAIKPSTDIVILSLIYIDRFIKSACEEDLNGLSRFNISR